MKTQKGQALIALLFFVLMAIGITAAATVVVSSNSLSTSDLAEGSITKSMADAGIETGVIALLRDPNYTGETLTMDDGNVVITVTGTTNKAIIAVATNGSFVKKVEFDVTYSNNVLIPGSWKEIN